MKVPQVAVAGLITEFVKLSVAAPSLALQYGRRRADAYREVASAQCIDGRLPKCLLSTDDFGDFDAKATSGMLSSQLRA